jgi:membrane protein implicated in regulation of membrane protease activity
MAFVVALLLAIFVLPSPWGIVAVVVGALIEVAEGYFGIKWTQRWRAQVGAETLIGATGRVVVDCLPEGQVVLKGERWKAVSEPPSRAGEQVVVEAVEGLRLRVRPAQPS